MLSTSTSGGGASLGMLSIVAKMSAEKIKQLKSGRDLSLDQRRLAMVASGF